MKTFVKMGSISVIVCISLFLVPFLAYSLDNELEVKLYVNDKETSFSVYENDTGYERYYLESFIPLNSVLSTLGFDVSQTTNNITIISEEDKIFVKVEFLDGYFKYDKYPSSEFKESYNGYIDTYIEIDGTYYIGLDRLATILGGEAVQRGDNIYFYTYKYYYDNVALSAYVGHPEDIAIYVNEMPIEAKVYFNRAIPEVSGPHNIGDYVELEPILSYLSANLNAEMRNKILNSEEIVYINNEKYIPFSQIGYLIDGSLRQDDYFSMYLYTADFVRTDIPDTLEKCYTALDSLLDDTSKEAIKLSSYDDLIDYHFGLGLWIRNNWIYPTQDRIYKTLLKDGIYHPDDMSQFIIEGYHYYLNGEEWNTEMQREKEGDSEKRREKDYLSLKLILLLWFVAVTLACRFLLGKLPRSTRFLEKIGRPKFLRAFLVLCLSGLLTAVAEQVIFKLPFLDFITKIGSIEISISEYIDIAFMALILSAGASIFFVDMTKKEIAISAVLPSICYLILYMSGSIYEEGLYFLTTYNDLLLWLLNPNMYQDSVGFIRAVAMLFPFVYVMLARSKSLKNIEEAEVA